MTVVKCIAVALIDILVMLFTGMLLFPDNRDVATIFPVWYILVMIFVAGGSAYIVARSDIKRKKKPETVEAEIVYVPGKAEQKEAPYQPTAIDEAATVQDSIQEKAVPVALPVESAESYIDVDKIIADEEEWRRLQRGLSPVEDEHEK